MLKEKKKARERDFSSAANQVAQVKNVNVAQNLNNSRKVKIYIFIYIFGFYGGYNVSRE